MLFTVVLSSSAAAQSASPLSRVAWSLADFVIVGDTAYGVQFLASPNLKSEQGKGLHMSTWLSLDPGVAHKWASGVSRIVDSVSHLSRGDRKPFETVHLVTNLGQEQVFVAFDEKGSESKPFVFVVSGAKSGESWWVPVSNKELQQLFGAFDSVASHSSVRLVPPTAMQNGPVLIGYLDEPPQIVDPGGMQHPDDFRALGRNARVLARFVIDTNGVVPAEHVEILLTDGKAFTDEVRRGLAHRTYRPGRRGGRAVQTVCWQWFNFTSN